MKIFKKILSLVLTFTVLASAATAALPVKTYAAATTGNYSYSDKLNTIKNRMHSAAVNYNKEFSVTDLDLYYSTSVAADVSDIFIQLANRGDTFHFSSFQYWYNPQNNQITKIELFFRKTKSEYQTMLNQCKAAADKLMLGIKGNYNLTLDQVLLMIHDRLATWCEYDETYINDKDNMPYDSYTMYGALVSRVAVCQGYAEAYNFLLDQLGFSNYVCTSAQVNHAWNIVEVYGKKYHIDVTWDDPAVDRIGRAQHNNLLVSSQRLYNGINGAYAHRGNDYDTSPNDTYYDDFWWENVNSSFQIIDDRIYYLNNKTGKINYFSGTSYHTTLASGITDTWNANATQTWVGNYACLTSDGTNLYYSKRNAIYKLNPKTGKTTVVLSLNLPTSQGIYGIAYENGKLLYSIDTSPLVTANEKTYYITVSNAGNTLKKVGNDWYYTKDGTIDYTANTLCYYLGKWYYVQNGKVNFNATTLCKYGNTWYYVEKGVVNFGKTTLCKYGNTWYYVQNGKVNFNATTLCKFGNTWYYVEKGVVNFGKTTLCKYGNTWYYVEKGVVNFGKTTLCKYGNTWFYVEKGAVNFGKTTLCKYGNTWYYVQNGKVNFNATTLCKFGNTWYYVEKGVVNFGKTTLCKYGNTWYYVEKGVVNFGKTTLCKYGNTWFYVEKGAVNFGKTTLCKYGNTWYYVQNGKVNFKANLRTYYNGRYYKVVNGVVR